MFAGEDRLSAGDGAEARNSHLQTVVTDCLRRRLAGEDIVDDVLIADHPDLMPELAEELRKLRLIDAAREQAAQPFGPELATRPHHDSDTRSGSGRLEVRCPSCHQPTQVAADTALTDLWCTACGSHFSLVDQTNASRMAPSLTKLGRFELIERLGVGGFGSVWKARDKELDRTVAIKIPRANAITPTDQEKFFREARAAAQLRHPNIVSVHEVGRDGDSIYIVSDFVCGGTLDDWLTGQRPTSREATELCAKIANALQHAHEQGVVHRDLKPANIMIDVDGQPNLMDFGLARRDVGEVTITVDGQVLGTPAYMSPEQAQGEAHAADRRSDIYSLGVILFQLLTGELPFRGNARMLMHQVINEEPPGPRKFNATISRDLEIITLKCLAKEPSGRYQTAHDLAADLHRTLVGEPIRARPTGSIERTLRWIRRNRTIALLSSTVALMLIVGTVLASYLAINARRQAEIALAREADALTAKQNEETARLAAVDRQKEAETARVEEARARQDAEVVSSFLVAAFQIPDPELDGRTITVAEILKRAEERLAQELPNQPLTQAALLIAIGESRLGLGLSREAIEALTKAQKLREEMLGADHSETLASLNTLAYAYQETGNLEKAVPLFERVFAARRDKLGPDHPDTLAALNYLAFSYQRADQLGKAIPLFERTLRSRRKILGANHADTFASMNNLAYAYQVAGRLSEAIPLFEQTLTARRQTLGLDHPDTLASINNLAYAYQDAKRLNDAIPLFEQALAARRNKLGSDHPDTFDSMNDLAYAYQSADRLSDAIPQFEQALTGRRKSLGADHSLTLASTNNLAYAYQVAKRLDDAIPLFERALAGRREKLGADHPDTLASMKNLAYALVLADRLDEARKVNRQMVEHGLFFESRLLAAKLGPDMMNEVVVVAMAHHDDQTLQPIDAQVLAELRLVAGSPDSAEPLIHAALDRDVNKLQFYNSLGWCQLAQGKVEEARQTFQQTLKDCKRKDGTYNLEKADPEHWTAAYFLDLVSEHAYVDHFSSDKQLACFPWFYIAQRYEIDNNQKAATKAYERCVEVGSADDSHLVRSLAEWRLQKLKKSPTAGHE